MLAKAIDRFDNLRVVYNKKETSNFNEGVQYSNIAKVSNNSMNPNEPSVNIEYYLESRNDTNIPKKLKRWKKVLKMCKQ